MLPNVKNDLFYFLAALESIGKIRLYLSDISSAEEFLMANDQMNFNASINLLANVGESLNKLSDESSKSIEGSDLIGIRSVRNRIVHDYQGLDSFLIFDIIKENLPAIENQLFKIITELLNQGNVDREEFEISMNSTFYKHIDFSKFQLN